jgi:hypothetical protein
MNRLNDSVNQVGRDKDDADTDHTAGGHWHQSILPTLLSQLVLRTQARCKEKGPLPASASSPAPTRRGSFPKTLTLKGPLWLHWQNSLFFCLLLLLAFVLTACNDQSQKPDSRLKYFTILSSRVLIEGNNAEVFGEVENTGQMKFPFDVTIQAELMDNNGSSVGNAVGIAEDVGPGQVRQFMLIGTVDGTRYARLKVMTVSLQEKRQELGWPTPTPISP